CCPEFTNFYTLGNIFEQSFEEIWFGKKLNKLRSNILEGDYSICNRDLCNGLDETQFIKTNTPPPRFLHNLKFPENISLSLDSICNVECIMCRDWNLPLDKNERARLYNKIDDLVYMMKDVASAEGVVTVDGCGEVFASRFYKDFIPIIVDKYPNIQFDIFTNGLFCNEEKIEEYKLTGRIRNITVSLHAMTEKTYNKVVKKSNFNTVMKNVEYLISLRNRKIIEEVFLTFVVCSYNYKDLPKFVEYSNEKNVKVNIWPIRPYNDCKVCNHIEDYDVTKNTHPLYQDFKNTLKDIQLKWQLALVNDQIMNLLEE
ncbi:MAG: radical SAM protein, partial [Candidatus Gastranaerophilaceae bacterium]